MRNESQEVRMDFKTRLGYFCSVLLKKLGWNLSAKHEELIAIMIIIRKRNIKISVQNDAKANKFVRY
jgi:hypothetical protein